jgi:putative tryptophan/tyrosine transport system substrate-binding protein
MLGMKRRAFITLLGGVAAWPLAARAQLERVRTIGYLNPGRPVPQMYVPFVEALRQLGWIEGKNLVIDDRYSDNDVERLHQLAAELVRLNVDVIVATGTLGPLAAKRATANIPIVMTAAGDPLGTGLVASLARPGGNVTGMSLMAPDLGGKRLEILKEIVPALSRVAVLWNGANPYPALVYRQTENAARQLGIEVHSFEVRVPGDLEVALETAIRQRPDALITVEDPLMLTHRNRISELAIINRLPSLFGLREYVEAGGLIAYGADLGDLNRRAAVYVDKILKGVRPSDLPVQQPTKFQLVVNLKTAKAVNIEIPPTLLARADEVIE